MTTPRLSPVQQRKIKAMAKLLPRLEAHQGAPMRKGTMWMKDYTGWKHKEP